MEILFGATIIICIVILGLAYLKKKIDASAVIASALVGAVVLFTLGDLWYWIYLILAFFVIGNLVSKFKFKEKEKNGVEQDIRTYQNVFGNGGSAVIFSIFYRHVCKHYHQIAEQ